MIDETLNAWFEQFSSLRSILNLNTLEAVVRKGLLNGFNII